MEGQTWFVLKHELITSENKDSLRRSGPGFYLFHFHSTQAWLNLSLIELSTLILQAHLKKTIPNSSI